MPIIIVDGKEIYADFVEYERSAETFADVEYRKWLQARDAERKETVNASKRRYSAANKLVAKLNEEEVK